MKNENIGVLLDGAANATPRPHGEEQPGTRIWAQGQTAGWRGHGDGVRRRSERQRAGGHRGARLDRPILRQVTVRHSGGARAHRHPHFEDIGDGIALFAGTTGATIDRVISQRNARAQLLADACGEGVKVAGSTVSAGGTGWCSAPPQPEVEASLIDKPGADLAVRAGAVELSP